MDEQVSPDRLLDNSPQAARLSRLLCDAPRGDRHVPDVVVARSGQSDDALRRLRDEIDAYRAEQGWSPDGYGGQNGAER